MSLHAIDDPAENGICVHIVIRQLIQAVDVPLLIPQNGVIIIARQIPGIGDCLIVVGHGRGVVLRTHGNDRCRLRFRLRPRLCLAADSIYPVHVFPPYKKALLPERLRLFLIHDFKHLRRRYNKRFFREMLFVTSDQIRVFISLRHGDFIKHQILGINQLLSSNQLLHRNSVGR